MFAKITHQIQLTQHDYQVLYKHKTHKDGLLLHPFDTGPDKSRSGSFLILLSFL